MKTKKFNYLLLASIFLLSYFVISTAYNAGKKLALRDNAETTQLKK